MVVYIVSIMADEGMDFIMQDLQNHIQNANVQVTNLSSIAKKGDDKVRFHLYIIQNATCKRIIAIDSFVPSFFLH